MFYVMGRELWSWSFGRAAIVSGLFLWVDLLFFGANMLKVQHGGWVPLMIAAVIFLLMTTWKRGREILAKRMLEKTVPLKMLLADLAAEPPTRVPGTAVFMYGTADHTPPALVHNLAHNKVLHEKVVFLTVVTEDVPHVEPRERVTSDTSERDSTPWSPATASWTIRTSTTCLGLAACKRSTSGWRERRSSSAARRSSPPTGPAWRSGGSSCSRSCRATRCGPRPSSRSRRTRCSRWERRSSSSALHSFWPNVAMSSGSASCVVTVSLP